VQQQNLIIALAKYVIGNESCNNSLITSSTTEKHIHIFWQLMKFYETCTHSFEKMVLTWESMIFLLKHDKVINGEFRFMISKTIKGVQKKTHSTI
jgi:hypothetical protein